MFIQIGSAAFNTDHVSDILFRHEDREVEVRLPIENGQRVYTFQGALYDVFMHWWNNYAEVWRG